ncbi:hypothetical protein AUK22_11630 [bacterium CG2_30_54_10]|nr:MAG: hypothetical protein AUK22_11630 [bacterium CG2_30_54_10]
MTRFRIPFFVLMMACILAYAQPAAAQEKSMVGYLDLGRVLSMHPLGARFAPQTQRFTGTDSQPPADLDRAIKNAKESIESETKRLASLKSQLEQEFKKPGKAGKTSSDIQLAYWQKRKKIEERLIISQSLFTEYSEMKEMGRSTSQESIAPVLEQVLKDVRDAIGETVARSGVRIVIDVSALNRRQIQSRFSPDIASVQVNPIDQIWRDPNAGKISPEALENWLDKAGEVVVRRFPQLGCPVPIGGVDLEPQMLRLLNPELSSASAFKNRSHP